MAVHDIPPSVTHGNGEVIRSASVYQSVLEPNVRPRLAVCSVAWPKWSQEQQQI